MMMKYKATFVQQIMSVGAFFYRRFRNMMVIMLISLLLVIVHCRLEQQVFGRGTTGIKGANSVHERIFVRSYNEEYKRIPLQFKTSQVDLITKSAKLTYDFKQREQLTSDENSENMNLKSTKDDILALPMVSENNLKRKEQSVQSSSNWLSQYTSNLPHNLHYLLEKMLLRNFSTVNSALETEMRVKSRERCKRGYFRLIGMDSCHKWLECKDTDLLRAEAVYGSGVGKNITASKWMGKYDVAVVSLRKDRYIYKMFVSRVQSGVDNMLLTQPSPYTTQVVGLCNKGNNTVMVMEGCKYGNFRSFYCSSGFRRLKPIEKFEFAIQMVAQFDYLHRGLKLPRVNCDLHTIMQAFGQYVVTEDKRLFLNDLDEVPEVNRANNTFPTCECEPYGIMEQAAFMAPEIRYTPAEHAKGYSRKPIDEAADVWKIPDLVANILVVEHGKRLFEVLETLDFDYFFKDQLKSIHERCKRINPKERPTTKEILIHYLKLYQVLLKENDK